VFGDEAGALFGIAARLVVGALRSLPHVAVFVTASMPKPSRRKDCDTALRLCALAASRQFGGKQTSSQAAARDRLQDQFEIEESFIRRSPRSGIVTAQRDEVATATSPLTVKPRFSRSVLTAGKSAVSKTAPGWAFGVPMRLNAVV